MNAVSALALSVARAMRPLFRLLVAWKAPLTIAVLTASLTGCGGGASWRVISANASALAYGQEVTLVVVGEALDEMTWSVTGCDGLQTTEDTVAVHVMTCTPNEELKVTLLGTGEGGTYTESWYVSSPQVRLTVQGFGDLIIDLEPGLAKETVDNFLQYVEDGFYDGTLFHRLIEGFVIQGGGFIENTGDDLVAQTGLRTPIALESDNGLSNTVGTVAMARTREPDSATSQFFINLSDNSASLDYQNASNPGYTVFGLVTTGMSLVESMALRTTGTVGSYSDVPSTDIIVTSATRNR